MNKPFDLTVHHRDSRTGRIVRQSPYKLVIEQGTKIFIRDGVRYFENGELVDKPKEQVEAQADKVDKQAEALIPSKVPAQKVASAPSKKEEVAVK